jgi:coproporphyrinogen III oxidase-like Fe-S oxidoreductase
LNSGVDLQSLQTEFPELFVAQNRVITELVDSNLIERQNTFIRLSKRGRLLSNEVFQRFLSPATV